MPAIADLRQELSTLTAAVQALTTNRHDDRGRAQDRGRSGRRGRSKSRGRRDRSSSPPHSGVCFYHHRFGEKARKCEKPCSFKSENSPSRAVNATTLPGSTTLGRLLHVRDRLHNVKFLVDTGAAVSVLPPSYCPLSSVSRSSSFRQPIAAQSRLTVSSFWRSTSAYVGRSAGFSSSPMFANPSSAQTL